MDALTLSSKVDRDAAFARTFQILGQQMHLIADLAAPAHTRNDPHCPSSDGFEAWAARSDNQSFIQALLAAPPVRPDPSIFFLGVPIRDSIAWVPIARLWDTDQYDKTNPGITLHPTIGLAEYSNANFFSDNTVFSSELPFPTSTSVELGSPEPEPRAGELRRYFKKVRDGEPIDHLAVPSALYEFLPEALRDQKKGLDENVFQDYAAKLLPRAVGYSAALLDYFFRGQFTVERVAPDLNKGNVGYVYVRVRNLGDERMAGRITFYYDDPKDGLRKVAPTQPFIIDLDPGASAEHSFNTLVDRGPDRMESRYIAVFDGRLGDDPNAVVASNLQITPPRPAFVCLGPDYCYMWFFGPPAGATLTIEATGTGNSGSITAYSEGCIKTECISEIPVSFGGAPAVSTWSFTAPTAPPVSDDGSSFSLDPLNVEAGGFVCIFDYWSSPITPEGDTVVKYANRGFSYSNCPEEGAPFFVN